MLAFKSRPVHVKHKAVIKAKRKEQICLGTIRAWYAFDMVCRKEYDSDQILKLWMRIVIGLVLARAYFKAPASEQITAAVEIMRGLYTRNANGSPGVSATDIAKVYEALVATDTMFAQTSDRERRAIDTKLSMQLREEYRISLKASP